MTSIERTAYPRFKRLITVRELYLFFAPAEEEGEWAAGVADSDEHRLALLLALKSYQRMGCFPKREDIPDQVVEFVRRLGGFPETTEGVYASGRTAERHRTRVRERCGVRYDAPAARKLAGETMRAEAVSKNSPADLINVALEKLVEAALEIPRYSTLDQMASRVRLQVNGEILAGVQERMSELERDAVLRLLTVAESDRTSGFYQLKQHAGRATWSHFRTQERHLRWVDGLGGTSRWLEGAAVGKVADFAAEAEVQDAAALRDYTEDKRAAMVACLVAKARMRARGELATMFCKRMAAKAKKAKDELAEIRAKQQALAEELIGNYRTLLQQVGQGGPAQTARAKAAALTKAALEGVDEDTTSKEVVELLGDRVSAAFLVLAEGLLVQASGLGSVTAAVERLGGFDVQYARIEQVSAQHGDNWEVLLHGHLKADRPVMFFIPCGVWEAIYIIEGPLKNASGIRPATIHADTQGQSFPVFSLAYLLGFDLMPRIRNWKDLVFFRPSANTAYQHIDALLGEAGRNIIDWGLIENHFKDLMRVAVSVREGAVSSPLLLRRLGSGSRRNATCTAFREVGRVLRTVALLRYLSGPALRRRVTAATNKVESYNGFADWLRFGQHGTVTSNDRDDQEKDIKFSALVTNCVIFRNTVDIADIVRQLQAEGGKVEPEDLAQISPCLTEHIKRFGEYSTHELAVVPDAYETRLDVDFSKLDGRPPGSAR